MLVRKLGKTLHQIFCKMILYFQVIVKNIKEADDNFMTNFPDWNLQERKKKGIKDTINRGY